ncbi:MAG: aspartate aminotransferase family protein [Acidiferrobacterales bacterium]
MNSRKPHSFEGAARVAEAYGDSNLSPFREAWAERNVDEKTRVLLDEDARHFLHQSISTPCLSAIRKAEGIWIEDMAGRRYMDFHGNNVHNIGYGHPRLIEAVKRQLDELSFTPRRFTDEPAIALARKLAEISPGDLGKIFLTTSGSDAIETALKLARGVTGRFKTVSFWDSFHGANFGGLSVGGEAFFRSGSVGPLLPGTEHVAPFACYRCPYGYKDIDGQPDLEVCKMTCADFVRYVLEKEGDVAAVIAEPVRSLPYFPPPGYWQAVRAACDEHGALLIFDEIAYSLGKSGRMFTCEHFEAVPDILCLGKALGGGVIPVAAVVAKPELDVLGNRAFGHYTHEKNPVSCRAALTTIEIVEEEGLVENARRVGGRALERLHEMANKHRLIGNVRGFGLILGVELVRDPETKEPAAKEADAVMYRALEKGLSFKTSMGNVLTLTPPLIISAEQMDLAFDILDSALGEVEQRIA